MVLEILQILLVLEAVASITNAPPHTPHEKWFHNRYSNFHFKSSFLIPLNLLSHIEMIVARRILFFSNINLFCVLYL